jgi:beta-lactamase class A
MTWRFLICILLAAQSPNSITAEWQKAAVIAQGKVGAVAVLLETGETAELLGDSRFPMQSVYKFPIAMAVLQRVDAGAFTLDQEIHVRKSDLVPPDFHSPIRDLHPSGDFELPLRDILRFAVSESDGTASDVLLRLLGGAPQVTAYLKSFGVKEIIVANTENEMAQAHDVQYRNWATPRAAVQLLRLFYDGRGLSAASRTLLVQWMTETQTGPKRLKGMLPPGTVVVRKTGTSGTSNGVISATNDIGLISLPDGRHVAIAVFVSDAKAPQSATEAVIAHIAKATWDHWNQAPTGP